MGNTRGDYQICSKTVMDTSDPAIWFDENGVSSHVVNFANTEARFLEAANSGRRKAELDRIVAAIKESGKDKPYDCVIGLSGGVDSSYLMLQAVQLGLRPLAVHFDSGWNSDLAVRNMDKIVETLDLDLVTDVADRSEIRDLQLAFLKSGVPNCDIPTDHAFPAVAFAQAERFGIKYILSGSNLSTESILPQSWGYSSADSRHLRAIHKRFGSRKLRTYPVQGIFKRYVWYEMIKGIKTVKLLNYMPYFAEEAKQAITDELGWQDYGGKHYESIFTRYFQGYYLPTRFGFDKRRAHLSSLIVSGQLTREQALAQLEESDYPEDLRRKDQAFIAERLGITYDEMDSLVAMPPVGHEHYPSNARMHAAFFSTARLGAKIVKPIVMKWNKNGVNLRIQ